MTTRVGYVLSALLLGAGALVGIQYSSATFTDDSNTPAQVTAARDWTPPTVSVNDPGFVINGVVSIIASAADDRTAVGSVEIQYRRQGTTPWVSLCVDGDGSPWDCTWDTNTVTDGAYELRAIATDVDGNTETSQSILTEVYNTASLVMDAVPSPIRATVTLTAHLVNAGNGSSRITFQGRPTGPGAWTDLTGCVNLAGPEASCSFNTTGYPDGTYDVRAVATRGPNTYEDIQTGIVVDNTAPTVTINQAAGQADPTNGSPINFTVVFDEPVTGFTEADVTLGGTTNGTKAATVTGSGTTYNVAVTGMTGDGTVTAVVPSGSATDEVGNASKASTSTDNSVQYDGNPTTVTIDQAAGQADPTNGSPINFTVVFSRSVTGFATGDVTVTGTAPGTKTATVTGSGATYNVAVTGVTGSGSVIASIGAGVANNTYGGGNEASTSTDNSVTADLTAPTVTINQAAGQVDPTNSGTINFTAVFSEPVTDFATGDVTVTGTAPGTKTATVSGSGTTYTVAVTGMTGTTGTVIATVPAGRATDAVGNANTASTSTDNTVTRDLVAPTVTVNQAAGQADPTTGSTINYTVVFSEPVTGFATGDVTLTGTTTGNRVATVTGSGTTYNVAVTGMIGDGTVIATVAAGMATDAAGNGNTVSTSTDNTVTYNDTIAPTVTIDQAATQLDPTNGSTINFTVVFSEPVTGFAGGDVTISGTTTGTKTRTVTGSGTTYNVAVTGMTSGGTVIATIAAGQATDTGANTNVASTSTDNTVTRDVIAPTVTINQASSQAGSTSTSPINFTVVFSEPVTGFTTGDVTIGGTAGGTKTGTVTGSGTTYNVAVSGMTTAGSVIASIQASRATDIAGNANTASTSADNTVTWLG